MRIKNWLPHIVTLVLAALLVISQQVWAGPITARLTSTTVASSKTTINYQGYLTDSNGNPVNDTLDIVFRFYNVESGGDALWTESQYGVPVTDGLFSVLLGSAEPLPRSLFEENDNLWLGISVGSDDEMLPREKIAGAPYALAGGGLPSGVIVMWSGSLAAIPDGWVLCDGTNGTPDLRDQFVVGAGNSYAVGETGGTDSVTLTIEQMPAHSHSASTSSSGEHTHYYWRPLHGTGIDHYNSNDYSVEMRWEQTSRNGAHTHDITVENAGDGQPHENRPPYYSLAFICRQ